MKFLENLKQKPRHGIAAPKLVGLVKIKRKRTQIFRRESFQSAIEGEMVRVATLWNEIENPNWSKTGRRKGEEEDDDEDDVAPLSSNGKSITIAPPTTTTFLSPIPSGATVTETTIPLPRPSLIRESDHNDVVSVS